MLTALNQSYKLLVRPYREHGESSSGYGLRLAEENGYPSMHVMLSYAGIDELTLRSNIPPIEILGHLLNRDLKGELTHEKKHKNTKHRLIYEEEISTMYVIQKQPRICPACVEENKFVKNLFDLKFYIGCSKHNKRLLSHCPACKAHVSWNRPGILKCKCNHIYDSSALPDLDPSISTMMALLEWKFEKPESTPERLIEYGYPISMLGNLDASILLYAIQRLIRKPFLHIHDSTLHNPLERSLEAFHKMFIDWPNGFYKYMEAHVEENKSSILTKKFSTFYRTFCMTGQQNKPIEFLHNIFIQFGNSYWKKSAIDTRSLNRANIDGEVVGVYSLANKLNVRLPTILQFVKDGIIKGHEIEDHDGVRTIFYMDELPFKPWNGKCFDQREAAAYLGIPLRLFRVLQKLNYFTKEHLAFGTRGYAEIDLLNFLKSFNLTTTQNIKKNFKQQIMLKFILARKHINLEFVAHLLQAARIGQIAAVFGNTIPELTFDVEDLNKFCYENGYPPFINSDTRNLGLF